MRSDTALFILRDLPKHWSSEPAGLRPEYAKQLLENKLIEEVEPGKYRTTQDGTRYAKEGSARHADEDMLALCDFTIEEIDLEPWEYRLQEEIARRKGITRTPEEIDAIVHSFLGKKAP